MAKSTRDRGGAVGGVRRPDVRAFLAAVVAVVLLGSGVSACGGGGSASGPPKPTGALANDAEILRGRELFANKCATCHGTDGGGGVGPSFKDGKLLRDFHTVETQMAFVKKGKGVMPSFGESLSDAEIRAIVRYEREVLSRQGD